MSYGIRVKNPLPKHVRVEIVDGKIIIRDTVIPPRSTQFFTLDKPGKYDFRTTIIERLPGAIDEELGPASFEVVGHEDVKVPQVKVFSIPTTVILKIPEQQKTARYWRDVITCKVTPATIVQIKAVEIEEREEVQWRLKIMNPGDGRFGGHIIKIAKTSTFNGLTVGGGQIIKLQARSTATVSIPVSARISGEETIVDGSLSPAKVETQPVEEEEEITVRSLSDMFDEMRKKEVAV